MDTTYTDFAKAFDKVCHSALKAKLSKLGFHSSFLNWIASYLNNRRYHFEVGCALSHPYKGHLDFLRAALLALYFSLFLEKTFVPVSSFLAFFFMRMT